MWRIQHMMSTKIVRDDNLFINDDDEISTDYNAFTHDDDVFSICIKWQSFFLVIPYLTL